MSINLHKKLGILAITCCFVISGQTVAMSIKQQISHKIEHFRRQCRTILKSNTFNLGTQNIDQEALECAHYLIIDAKNKFEKDIQQKSPRLYFYHDTTKGDADGFSERMNKTTNFYLTEPFNCENDEIHRIITQELSNKLSQFRRGLKTSPTSKQLAALYKNNFECFVEKFKLGKNRALSYENKWKTKDKYVTEFTQKMSNIETEGSSDLIQTTSIIPKEATTTDQQLKDFPFLDFFHDSSFGD